MKSIFRTPSLQLLLVLFFSVFLLTACKNSRKTEEFQNKPETNNTFVNKVETYRVTWWNMPISFGLSGNWARAMFGIININNGELAVRHAILEGRPLGDFRLPYWPISSFLSIYSNSMELAHQSDVSFKMNGELKKLPFRCGDPKYRGSDRKEFNRMKRIEEGFEVAGSKHSDILKITNKGSESPVLMEHHFMIEKGSKDIPVIIKASNAGEEVLNDVVVGVTYQQDFNWSAFGIKESDSFQQVKAPDSGIAKSFYAYSSGMDGGFEFHHISGGELSYTLKEEMNAWQVYIKNQPVTLEPGESLSFSFHLRMIEKPDQKNEMSEILSGEEIEALEFVYLKPVEIRSAPVDQNRRVTINDMFKNLNQPKVRGLHCISGLPDGLDDLETLKEWSGNLAVAGPHSQNNVDETWQIIERGNELGIEMLVAGRGAYYEGVKPEFDHLFDSKPANIPFPDAYGQDEDHSYWYPVKPTIDFKKTFGKSMSEATTEEKVLYWSKCFKDKWMGTLADVRSKDPDGDIWFYMPTPGLAHLEPLDYYDLFFDEVADLGDALTVLPFYYGPDYNQIEYMVRRWKDAGAKRVAFLPGAPTYSRPSQFMKAATAARRGGADGTCGFAFSMSVYDQFGFISFDHDWRWKALMLAAHANFPTPELNAYSFIEEPSSLIEALAVSDVYIHSDQQDIKGFSDNLELLLPGEINVIRETHKTSDADKELHIFIEKSKGTPPDHWSDEFEIQNAGPEKGIIQFSGNKILISGSDQAGIENGLKLFLKFAELAKVESLYNVIP